MKNFKYNLKKQLAFTLVELIIVIAIISLLSAIVVVTLNPFSIFQSGRNSQRANDLSTIQNAITRYLSETPITGAAHYLSDLHGYNDLLNSAAEGNFICPNGSNLDTLTNYYSLDTSGTNIIDLSNLLNGGYLPRVPKDPSTNSSYRACVDTANNSKVILFGAKTESSSSTVAAALNTPTPNSGISNGLVGYWKMDEASWNGTAGEVKDASGFGNNGVSQGGATTTTGKYSNGGNFNGSNYISFGNKFSENNDFTIAFWEFSLTSAGGFLVSKDQSGQPTCQFRLTIGNSAYFSNNILFNWGVNNIGYNQWNHIVLVRKSTTYTFFVNGQYQISTTIATPINCDSVSSPYDFRVGARMASGGGADGGFTGNIDETRVYNRALSSTDVSALYNWGPSPIAYYRFDEGSGNTVYDGSVNGLNGTWNGTGTPRYTSGKYGSAGNFNGSTDYVNIPTMQTSTSFTVEGWIYLTAAASNNTRFFENIGTTSTAIAFNTSRFIRYYDDNSGSPTWVTTTSQVNFNTWTYISITSSNNQSLIYINGQNPFIINKGFTLNSYFKLGVQTCNCADYFTGQMDEVKVYNYARTAAQIQADMY